MKMSSLLFITSFIPTIVFKIIARMGDPTIEQAQLATAAGLILAMAQLLVSHRVLKETTYLEWAFLGFLLIGVCWVFAAPREIARIYVLHNTALLYFVLFLTTFLPQTLGYDPFTYVIAKRWQPEVVWNTVQFKKINLHITWLFSGIMFLAFLSNVLGQGRILYSVVFPVVLIVGIGIPFSRAYPQYYLGRQAASEKPDVSAGFPPTVKALVLKMPDHFKQDIAGSLRADIQFHFSGPGGGSFVLSIDNGFCSSWEGIVPSPDLTIQSPGDIWMQIACGQLNPQKAFIDNLYLVKGDMMLLMKMKQLFSPPVQK